MLRIFRITQRDMASDAFIEALLGEHPKRRGEVLFHIRAGILDVVKGRRASQLDLAVLVTQKVYILGP